MKGRSLSRDLEIVIESAGSAPNIRLGDFVKATGDKAFGVVMLVLALPSALPIPATGISTPLGVGIFLIALQMIAGRQRLWLPEKLLQLKINKSTAKKMIAGLTWLLVHFEKLFRPRMPWVSSRAGHIGIGILVALLSVVMQAPIPLTNTLPAMVIFCLALSQMEDDGLWGLVFSAMAVAVITAYILGAVAILYYGLGGYDQLLEFLKSKS